MKSNKLSLYAVSIIFLTSLYLFSRFTVDDAFISWRHGVNLINSGFFNYNPSGFDMTQSYTNPIFAALSIFPAYFSIDMVLFFKVFSFATIVGFLLLLKKKYNRLILPMLFMSIPATMIHAFSGLETLLFAVLITILYQELKRENVTTSILVTSLLFLVRPESFLLAILVPIYFLTKKNGEWNPIYKIRTIFNKHDKKSYMPLILPFILFGILLFHKLYFGSFLPNTFYIKSVNNEISYYDLIVFICLSFPALIGVSCLYNKENSSLFYVFFIFFLAMVVNYSTSSLQMNYAQRFLFHIYAPLFFILLIEKTDKLIFSLKSKKQIVFSFISSKTEIASVFIASFFFFIQLSPLEILNIADYYPRAQVSHASLGYAIKNSGAKSMSFGDAGMTAMNAEIDSLDNIGLGSSLVAKNGVNEDVLKTYDPDVILFHAHPDSGIWLGSHYQQELYDWANDNNMSYVCDSIWRKNYSISIYAKSDIAIDDVKSVCENSKYNLLPETRTIMRYVLSPPWLYWNNKSMLY